MTGRILSGALSEPSLLGVVDTAVFVSCIVSVTCQVRHKGLADCDMEMKTCLKGVIEVTGVLAPTFAVDIFQHVSS